MWWQLIPRLAPVLTGYDYGVAGHIQTSENAYLLGTSVNKQGMGARNS
jgi:hypothetical protein